MTRTRRPESSSDDIGYGLLISRSEILAAGLPPATVRSGRSETTTADAATTQFAPMLTPGPTKARVAIQVEAPTVIGLFL